MNNLSSAIIALISAVTGVQSEPWPANERWSRSLTDQAVDLLLHSFTPPHLPKDKPFYPKINPVTMT